MVSSLRFHGNLNSLKLTENFKDIKNYILFLCSISILVGTTKRIGMSKSIPRMLHA